MPVARARGAAAAAVAQALLVFRRQPVATDIMTRRPASCQQATASVLAFPILLLLLLR